MTENAPDYKHGILGPLLEPYYVVSKPGKKCESCGSSWRGHYASHMEYCHFCGIELEPTDPILSR